MEGIPRIVDPDGSADLQGMFDAFFTIERNARLSGNASVLMTLDRIEGLLLGPVNRVSEGAAEAAVASSIAALESILGALDEDKPTSG